MKQGKQILFSQKLDIFVQQKPTQHCKAIILQLKIKNKYTAFININYEPSERKIKKTITFTII